MYLSVLIFMEVLGPCSDNLIQAGPTFERAGDVKSSPGLFHFQVELQHQPLLPTLPALTW
jgi:hypothetical protein